MTVINLKAKFALLTGVMLLSVSIIITTSLTKQQESTIRDELHRRATALTETLAYNCQLPLVTENEASLRQLAAGLQNSDDVVYIEFSSADKQSLLKIGENSRTELNVLEIGDVLESVKGTRTTWLQLSEGSEILDILTPVSLGQRSEDDILASKQHGGAGDLLGYVQVGISAEAAKTRIAEMRNLAFLLGAITTLLGSIVAAAVIHFMTRSLSRLMEGNQRLAKGDFSVRLEAKSRDEFGRLASSFNQMAKEVESSRELANRYLENLRLNSDKLEEANSTLQLNNEEIAKVSQMKSEFLAIMSHELRTPLNGIIGFSEVLLDEKFGELNEKQTRFIGNSLTSGRHLLALINNILDLSKIEAGKMQVTSAAFSLSQTVGEIQDVVGHLAQKKEIALNCDVVEDLCPETDEMIIKQILFNLLSNAIKFTPNEGSVEVSVRQLDGKDLRGEMISRAMPENHREGIPDEPVLLFEIQDNGVGIAPMEYDRVFVEFQQLDETYSRKQEGTGLGLALTRKLVHLLRGYIWFTSQRGEGSRFVFYVPTMFTELAESSSDSSDHVIFDVDVESGHEETILHATHNALWPWGNELHAIGADHDGDPGKAKASRPEPVEVGTVAE